MNTNSRISYPYLNGCDDLLKFMYDNYSEPYTSYADFEGTEIKFEMEHTEFNISIVMSYGYTREEAINILDGKNPDGSKFIELPF